MKYQLGLSGEPLTNTIDNRLTGVGMIRSEYLCRIIKEYITTETCQKFVRDYVSNVCKLFYPNEVWYRTTELVVSEINLLKGADEIKVEKDCYLGSRGIRRAMKHLETFTLELENLNEVAKEYDNLNVMFPFIYDPKELEVSIETLNKVKFSGKYGIMAEIPSAILLLDEFAKQGISNITVGVNDLTSLTLGISRGECPDHTHPAVIKLIELANKIGQKFNIPVSVGGYVSIELKSICERIGIDSFVVHYNALPEILKIPKANLEYLHFSTELKDKYV